MSPQAGWLLVNEIYPRIKSAVRRITPVGSEDPEELAQDAIAMAAKMLNSAEQKNKKVTAGNIAYYTLQHVKSGRRSTGNSKADVLASGTQIHGRSRMSSFNEEIRAEEEFGDPLTIHEVFSTDHADPSMSAARKMDWDAFLERQSERAKAIVVCLVEGGSLSKVARKFQVSNSTIGQLKKDLGIALLLFMGDEILVDVQRKPQWKSDLLASRERLACWEERKMA